MSDFLSRKNDTIVKKQNFSKLFDPFFCWVNRGDVSGSREAGLSSMPVRWYPPCDSLPCPERPLSNLKAPQGSGAEKQP